MSKESNLRMDILDRIAGRMQHLQNKRIDTARAGEQVMLDTRIKELRWLFDEVSGFNEGAPCATPTSATD